MNTFWGKNKLRQKVWNFVSFFIVLNRRYWHTTRRNSNCTMRVCVCVSVCLCVCLCVCVCVYLIWILLKLNYACYSSDRLPKSWRAMGRQDATALCTGIWFRVYACHACMHAMRVSHSVSGPCIFAGSDFLMSIVNIYPALSCLSALAAKKATVKKPAVSPLRSCSQRGLICCGTFSHERFVQRSSLDSTILFSSATFPFRRPSSGPKRCRRERGLLSWVKSVEQIARARKNSAI